MKMFFFSGVQFSQAMDSEYVNVLIVINIQLEGNACWVVWIFFGAPAFGRVDSSYLTLMVSHLQHRIHNLFDLSL